MKESLLPVNQRNGKERRGEEKKQQKETRKGVRRRGNEKMSVRNPDTVCEAVSKPHSKQWTQSYKPELRGKEKVTVTQRETAAPSLLFKNHFCILNIC